MSESRDALARGAQLFASERYFEAHEVWEECWRALDARDERRALLQGLVQAAVACHHAQQGNASGARSLARKALALLGPDAEVDRSAAEGLDLAPIRARIQDLAQRESS